MSEEQPDYELLAMDLEEHIAYYVPKGWRVPVKNVDNHLYLLGEQFENMESAYKKDELDIALDELGLNNEVFKRPYIRNAIFDFFDQK